MAQQVLARVRIQGKKMSYNIDSCSNDCVSRGITHFEKGALIRTSFYENREQFLLLINIYLRIPGVEVPELSCSHPCSEQAPLKGLGPVWSLLSPRIPFLSLSQTYGTTLTTKKVIFLYLNWISCIMVCAQCYSSHHWAPLTSDCVF